MAATSIGTNHPALLAAVAATPPKALIPPVSALLIISIDFREFGVDRRLMLKLLCVQSKQNSHRLEPFVWSKTEKKRKESSRWLESNYIFQHYWAVTEVARRSKEIEIGSTTVISRYNSMMSLFWLCTLSINLFCTHFINQKTVSVGYFSSPYNGLSALARGWWRRQC